MEYRSDSALRPRAQRSSISRTLANPREYPRPRPTLLPPPLGKVWLEHDAIGSAGRAAFLCPNRSGCLERTDRSPRPRRISPGCNSPRKNRGRREKCRAEAPTLPAVLWRFFASENGPPRCKSLQIVQESDHKTLTEFEAVPSPKFLLGSGFWSTLWRLGYLSLRRKSDQLDAAGPCSPGLAQTPNPNVSVEKESHEFRTSHSFSSLAGETMSPTTWAVPCMEPNQFFLLSGKVAQERVGWRTPTNRAGCS